MERIPKWLINGVLGIIILIQLGLLLMMHKPNLLRNSLQQQINQETHPHNLSLELGNLEFSPWNRLYCWDLELRSIDTPNTPLAEIKEVRIEIAPLSLLTGKPQVAGIELRGARMICPAIYSPTGTPEEVLKDLSCNIRIANKKVRLNEVSFRLHNATISSTLREGPPIQLPKAKPTTPEKPLQQTINQTLAKLYTLKPYLAKLENPTLHLTARSNGHIDAELDANSLQIPEIFSSDHISLYTRIDTNLEQIQFKAPLTAKLDNTLFRKQIRATHVHLQYSIPDDIQKNGFKAFPFETKVSTTEILYNAEPVGRFIGDIRLADLNNLNLLGTLGLRNSYLAIDTQVQLDQRTAQVQSKIKLHQNDLQHLHAFIPRKYLQVVKFRNPIEGSLKANISPGWKPTSAEFSLQTGQLVAMDVPIAKLEATGNYSPGELQLQHFAVQLKPGNVTGSLHQDLNTLDYRLLLDGEFFPYQINPWMEDWWEDLWARFRFTGLPVKANFSLEGKWDTLNKRDIFGEATIDNASYRGVPFTQLKGRLRSIPKYTELFDLNAKLKEGYAKGTLSWILHPTKRNRLTSQRFSLQGKLLPETAGKLFGKEVTEALQDFKVAKPAKVESSGVIYGREPPAFVGRNPTDAFAVSCQTDELTYQSIPLKNLDLFLHARGPALTIRPLKFDFAQGSAEGWLKHRPSPAKESPLEISMQFRDLNKKQALEHLSLNPRLKKQITPPAKDSSNKAIIESMQVHAIGNPDEISSFQGKGKFNLFDPDLAKVNMLSLLSKELTALTLPLISYRFNRMKSDFTLKDKKLVIAPDPLLITGPNAKVEATGNLHLKTQDLNFRVKLFPLGIPLAGILEMRLGGKLNKPKWNPTNSPASPKN